MEEICRNATEHLKSIMTNCPICKNKLDLKINPDLILNASNYPVAMSIIHCNFTIIIYIDAKFKVRGVESALTLNNSDDAKKKHNIPELKSENGMEDHVFYHANRSHNYFLAKPTPSLLEKQLLLTISKKEDYIGIHELLEKMKKVGKALNLNVDEGMIEKIVGDYCKEGSISKLEI